MLGSVLEGRYTLRAELGRGGNGLVFLAQDEKLQRAVVVKVLAFMAPGTEHEAIQRIEREARVSSAFNHPHVCGISDIGRLPNGLPFVVLEFLEGESLDKRLEKTGKLSLQATLVFAEQMLLGLATAHRMGIVHRDVKPANMFLVRLGHGRDLLKILDFGHAVVPGGPPSEGATLTQTGHVVGTAHYMAPEQVRGVRAFDPRTDVYAAGVVIFEMLVGHRPFPDLPLAELFEAIAFKQAPPLASVAPLIPRAIARAVDVALTSDLLRRHADAGVFLEALRTPSAEAGDDWDLPTRQGRALVPESNADPSSDDWELPTHRIDVPSQQAYSGASSVDVEVTFMSEEPSVIVEPEPPVPPKPPRRR